MKARFPPVTNQALHICMVSKEHSCRLDQNKMAIPVLITELRKLIERLVRILQ